MRYPIIAPPRLIREINDRLIGGMDDLKSYFPGILGAIRRLNKRVLLSPPEKDYELRGGTGNNQGLRHHEVKAKPLGNLKYEIVSCELST